MISTLLDSMGDWFVGPSTPIGPIVGFQMTELTQLIFTLMMLILVAAFFRIAFSNIPARFTYHRYLPESAMVILVGIVLGGVIRLCQSVYGIGKTNILLSFNDQFFFMFLIPPLILESGYFLNKDFFARHISLILLYAVVGTFITSIAVGVSLYIFGFTGLYKYSLSLLDCLLFGTLISAVDPVAVLAIFEDLQVNETLYMLVFGESVLNDAVSIVLYQLFVSLRKVPNLHFNAIYALLATTKLFYVSIGGILVGLVFGFFASFSTRFTSHTPLLEPLLVLVFAFSSYIASESILTSGIMSILFCGAFMSRYVELNISKKSHTTFKYGLKLIASTAETLVFIYFGMSIVLHRHSFDWAFALATIVCILVFRFLCIFGITIVYNLLAKRQGKATVSLSEQFILSYSGLRGIVFALAFVIPDDPAFKVQKDTIITTTMIASCFTIFIQGSTIRPIMKRLAIKSEKKTKKQVSQELVAEKFSLNIEEREISNAMKHIIYLDTTTAQMPQGNSEREEFQEVNHLIEEKVLLRVLGEVEELNAQIIRFNNDYINTQFMIDFLQDKSTEIDKLQRDWRKYIEDLGLEKSHEASSEILSTFSMLRQYLYPGSTSSASSSASDDSDIESQSVNDSRSGSLEGCNTVLCGLLEQNGVVTQLPNGSYDIADWAKNEDALYYLRRILQEENMEYWISQAYYFLECSQLEGVLPLLKSVRYEIQRQQENRQTEIDHLKRIDFASKVLCLGIKHTVEAIESLAGTAETPVISWPKYWAKKIDRLLQRICVRSLHAEESSLVRALSSLRKFELNLNCMEVGMNEQEDELGFIQNLQEQEKALRILQEASNNPKVNFQRVWKESEGESTAGKELTNLLDLDKDVIDENEYNLRVAEDIDTEDVHDLSKTRRTFGGEEFEDEKLGKKIRAASKRYEEKLCVIEEEVLPAVGVNGIRRASVLPHPTGLDRRLSIIQNARRLSLAPPAIAQRRNTIFAPETFGTRNATQLFVPSRRQSITMDNDTTTNTQLRRRNSGRRDSAYKNLTSYNPFQKSVPKYDRSPMTQSPSSPQFQASEETLQFESNASRSRTPSPSTSESIGLNRRRSSTYMGYNLPDQSSIVEPEFSLHVFPDRYDIQIDELPTKSRSRRSGRIRSSLGVAQEEQESMAGFTFGDALPAIVITEEEEDPGELNNEQQELMRYK